MKYRFVFWIDQEDYFPTRIEQEMIGDGSRMQKGSTITWDFTRLPEGAWLPKTCTIHYQLKMMKMFTARGESLQTFSDFHRFAVDSKIVEESK